MQILNLQLRKVNRITKTKKVIWTHKMILLFSLFLVNCILSADVLSVSFDELPQSAGKRRFFHSGVVVPASALANETKQLYWTFGGLTDYETVSCDVDVLHLGNIIYSHYCMFPLLKIVWFGLMWFDLILVVNVVCDSTNKRNENETKKILSNGKIIIVTA